MKKIFKILGVAGGLAILIAVGLVYNIKFTHAAGPSITLVDSTPGVYAGQSVILTFTTNFSSNYTCTESGSSDFSGSVQCATNTQGDPIIVAAPPAGVPRTYTITAVPGRFTSGGPISASVTVTSLSDFSGTPIVSVSNTSQAVNLTLNPSSGNYAVPYNEDFRFTICWTSSGCMTTPWASSAILNGGIDGRPGFSSVQNAPTGEWTPWFWPGSKDAMQAGDVYIQSIQTSTLPAAAGGKLMYPEIHVQLAEDDNGPPGNYTDTLCGPAAFQGEPGNGGVIAPITPNNCPNPSNTPDIMRVSISGYFETPVSASGEYDAKYISNNFPASFTPSQNVGIGTDGLPLEITVQNTGQSTWPSNGATTAISESGSCSTPVQPSSVLVCPSVSAPVGSTCTVTLENWGSDFSLKHLSGSFNPGIDPATYANQTQSICTLGAASCSNNSATCDASQAVCESAGTCKALFPGGEVGTCNDPTSCFTDVSQGGCSVGNGAYFATGCNGVWQPQYSNYQTGNTDTPPGSDAEFLVNTLTAPATPGSYTEVWQIFDPTQISGGSYFGPQMPIQLSVAGAPAPVTVSVNCSPSSISITGTSQCTATVSGPGNPSQTVNWSATNGTITSGGVFTPSGPGSATITATSAQDPSATNSTTVTITVPTGTVIVNSIDSQLQNYPVSATWDFPANGLSSNCQTSATYSNQPYGVPYIVYPINSCIQNFSFDSFREVPIAVHTSKSLGDQLLSFGKNMLASVANAVSVSPVGSLTLSSSNPSVTFTILWDPSASMSLSQNSISPNGTAGGSPVDSSITITNTGAPGSTLTWTTNTTSPWLNASPSADPTGLTNGASGNASENVVISADPSTLTPGTYTGTINFIGTSLPLTPSPSPINQTVTVTFTVTPSGGGAGAGFDCVSNACVAVPSGASYPNPGGAASCAAACGSSGPSNPSGPSGPSSPSGPSGNCGGSPCGAPVCTFSASPSSIIIPQQATLSYNCSGIPPSSGSSCTITGGNISSPITLLGNSSNAVVGTTQVSPTSNSTYTISCTGPGGTTSATASVNIGNSSLCESNPGGVKCPGQ